MFSSRRRRSGACEEARDRSSRLRGDAPPLVGRAPCPVNTKPLYNIYTAFDQRRRRWADVV